jgi:hypothetical protein
VVGYYVQVRRSPASDWVTIDVTEDRRAAAVLAVDAFGIVPTGGGGSTEVRVISTTDLVDEGGRPAINRAAIDLWRRDQAPQPH